MNEAFKTRLKEAILDEIPELLEALQQHYEQIPSYQKGTFNQLKKEFIAQPNNFSLDGWRSRFLVLISGFKFDVEVPNTSSSGSPSNYSKPTVTQHHSGSGDNVAGDKIIGDKVMGDKIGKQINVGRDYIKTQYVNQGSSEENNGNRQKILFLSANPMDADRLQIDREYSTIQKRLESSSQRDTFELLNPALSVTVQDLIKAMNQKPEIVHFSGHGGGEKGILIANSLNEAQLMPTSAVKRLFRQHQDSTKLVILNACYSAEQAEVISQLDIYVVGMNDVADDGAAISFAGGLYSGLGEGKDVERAFDDAMIIIDTDYPNSSLNPEIWHKGEKLDL
ncbi:hypothetical protein BKI52_42680 [marine bacterium AO1-C]|nr:hypothetical protein BKI52_42680 [marine bacterium AO1-C]